MKPADQIRRLINESQMTSSPEVDARILRGGLDELDRCRTERTPRPAALWSVLMNSKTNRLAAAAAVVIALLVGYSFLSTGASVTWAQVIEPILKARTAEFDLVIGDETDDAMVIHDQVMGSRIRRSVPAVSSDVSIIDLEAGRILTLSEQTKEAQYTNLAGLPSIPNYMEHLRNVIVTLQQSPGFVQEDLGLRQIDGQEVVGFLAKHPRAEITIWADARSGLPVRIEQNEGQMRTICKNMVFDVPLDESLFSMDVPEGYKLHEESTLDLQGGTEEAFIAGLRLLAETFNDGRFPAGVSVEDYLKQASDVARQIKGMDLSDEQTVAISQTIQNYLLFTRFFKGEGEWTYQGQGVLLGDAETPIFWYRPQDSETYRVIYGDLHVEDVAPDDLPEPLPSAAVTDPDVGYQPWSRPEFVGSQETFYYVQSDARVRVEAHLTLLRGPEDATLMPIRLPQANASLESVRLGDPGRSVQDFDSLSFEKAGDDTYNVELPLDKLSAGSTTLVCQWHLPLEQFSFERGKYWVDLQGLIPVISCKVNVGVDPGSGFELTLPAADGWANPFTSALNKEPATEFGRCALAIQKRR